MPDPTPQTNTTTPEQALSQSDLFYRKCGDCGQFVERERWIRKDNPYGYTRALCLECLSCYDEPHGL